MKVRSGALSPRKRRLYVGSWEPRATEQKLYDIPYTSTLLKVQSYVCSLRECIQEKREFNPSRLKSNSKGAKQINQPPHPNRARNTRDSNIFFSVDFLSCDVRQCDTVTCKGPACLMKDITTRRYQFLCRLHRWIECGCPALQQLKLQ